MVSRGIDEEEGYKHSKKAGAEDSSSTGYVLEEILGELGSVSQECREVSWQEARKSYSEVLTSLASKYLIDPSSLIGQNINHGLEGFRGGDEHILVKLNEPENETSERVISSRIYKITHSECFGCNVPFDAIASNPTAEMKDWISNKLNH